MARIEDIIGQKFGKLTVVSRESPSQGKKRRARWLCKCDCGNTTVVYDHCLKSGNTKSCGKCRERKDLTGKRFGRLIVVERGHRDKWRAWYWVCKCDCGKETHSRGTDLLSGVSSSCGCYNIEQARSSNIKHDLSHSRVYRTHASMLQRCYNPKHTSFFRYGGRDITVCDEWKTFENFLKWSQDNGYTDKLTIERIDVNGNYEPSNCIWIPQKDQAKNTTRTNYITLNGETLSISEWEKRTGIKRGTLYSRFYIYKWSEERTLTTPVQTRTKV